jgi:hypothetical protein
MTEHPLEELEAHAAGACASRELAAHLAGCAGCRRELAWLRAEGAMTARALDATDGPAAPLWAGVAARLADRAGAPGAAAALPAVPSRSQPAARRSSRAAGWARRSGLPGLAGAAAVAVLVVLVRAGSHEDVEPGLPPSAALALAHAGEEYRAAIAVLESRVDARHGAVPDARARAGLARARAAARDPSAQVQLLEGYASYLKSLRRSLDSGEAGE